jgi:hypothetical protein
MFANHYPQGEDFEFGSGFSFQRGGPGENPGPYFPGFMRSYDDVETGEGIGTVKYVDPVRDRSREFPSLHEVIDHIPDYVRESPGMNTVEGPIRSRGQGRSPNFPERYDWGGRLVDASRPYNLEGSSIFLPEDMPPVSEASREYVGNDFSGHTRFMTGDVEGTANVRMMPVGYPKAGPPMAAVFQNDANFGPGPVDDPRFFVDRGMAPPFDKTAPEEPIRVRSEIYRTEGDRGVRTVYRDIAGSPFTREWVGYRTPPGMYSSVATPQTLPVDSFGLPRMYRRFNDATGESYVPRFAGRQERFAIDPETSLGESDIFMYGREASVPLSNELTTLIPDHPSQRTMRSLKSGGKADLIMSFVDEFNRKNSGRFKIDWVKHFGGPQAGWASVLDNFGITPEGRIVVRNPQIIDEVVPRGVTSANYSIIRPVRTGAELDYRRNDYNRPWDEFFSRDALEGIPSERSVVVGPELEVVAPDPESVSLSDGIELEAAAQAETARYAETPRGRELSRHTVIPGQVEGYTPPPEVQSGGFVRYGDVMSAGPSGTGEKLKSPPRPRSNKYKRLRRRGKRR